MAEFLHVGTAEDYELVLEQYRHRDHYFHSSLLLLIVIVFPSVSFCKLFVFNLIPFPDDKIHHSRFLILRSSAPRHHSLLPSCV